MIEKKLSSLSDPLLNALFSAIIIMAEQRVYLEKQPVKCCINQSLNSALERRLCSSLNAAVSIHARTLSYCTLYFLCAAILAVPHELQSL